MELLLDERKKIASKNKCCSKCLKQFHRANKCRTRITCALCGKHHFELMCRGNSDTKHVENKECNIVNDVKGKDVPKKESNYSNSCSAPEVFLKTLKIVVYNGNREKVVRALTDSGSERSYITPQLSAELGYESVGKEEVIHALFGGVSSKVEIHNIYKVHVRDLDNTFACNFDVRDQKVICNNVKKIKTDAFLLNELKRKNISLSDLRVKSDDEIEFLIGGMFAID